MRLLLLFPALLPLAAAAQPADIARAVRDADWGAAQQDAAAYPDPIAAKLVTFYRLQHAGDARAGEIAAFLAANPDWPNQALLRQRRDEAVAAEPDDAAVVPLCNAKPGVPAPASGAALARCADALNNTGHPADAAAAASSAYVAGFADPDSEARFLAQWSHALTPADYAARFDALLAANAPQAPAQAELARLDAADRPLARARLALRGGAPNTDALVAALPPQARRTPVLVLEELRALRRAQADAQAKALWQSQGFAAEAAAGAPLLTTFWAERNQLARRLLTDGDAAGALLLADDTLQTAPETQTDSAFLAGFIVLRKLDRPRSAQARFTMLVQSTAAITQARAHYWLARAAAAAGDSATATREYQAAAAWPTVYYGQLAALALGDDAAALDARIATLAEPAWSDAEALDFAGRDLTRAAAMLVAWGDPARARPFLQQLIALSSGASSYAIDAQFALGLGLPDQAVAAARRAGRDGVILAGAGWPSTDLPPDSATPAALALAIVRQESSFDPGAISPTGARGLMQLMPGTAALTGRQLGLPVRVDDLIVDPALNLRLGTAYLAGLIDRFGGSLPLAIAAYNAGPSRVDQWLAANGDPRGAGQGGMIDWIEQIPFSETRNYVQRVVENIAVYRARRHETQPYPVSQ